MEELEGWENALKGIAPSSTVNQVNHVANVAFSFCKGVCEDLQRRDGKFLCL